MLSVTGCSTTIYFNKLHHSAPMIHRSRYESSLRLPSDLQPPTCLQHAIMAMGAGADPSHSPFATTLYQQARSLAEADEISVRSRPRPHMAQVPVSSLTIFFS